MPGFQLKQPGIPVYRKNSRYTGIPVGNPYTVYTGINGITYSYNVGNPKDFPRTETRKSFIRVEQKNTFW